MYLIKLDNEKVLASKYATDYLTEDKEFLHVVVDNKTQTYEIKEDTKLEIKKV